MAELTVVLINWIIKPGPAESDNKIKRINGYATKLTELGLCFSNTINTKFVMSSLFCEQVGSKWSCVKVLGYHTGRLVRR